MAGILLEARTGRAVLPVKEVLMAGGGDGSAPSGAEPCAAFGGGWAWPGLGTLVAMKLSGFWIVRGSDVVPACQWLVGRAGKAAALPGSLDRRPGAGGVRCFSSEMRKGEASHRSSFFRMVVKP